LPRSASADKCALIILTCNIRWRGDPPRPRRGRTLWLNWPIIGPLWERRYDDRRRRRGACPCAAIVVPHCGGRDDRAGRVAMVGWDANRQVVRPIRRRVRYVPAVTLPRVLFAPHRCRGTHRHDWRARPAVHRLGVAHARQPQSGHGAGQRERTLCDARGEAAGCFDAAAALIT